ncbi:stemmadenine O-acetyltransferase-like [Rhodamnia argentea]|uniref:Stemmadenine O-acetyltransferase-like n=1 Tax=Rhodamnia argentea TaxID=178133 RepID=A0A8B8Q6D7_9MYRT|nr:stemmadenine O-acetyltransferase-like [Rhodamnia argentea]
MTMAEVQVEVISKDTIKPSSPTPDHLRHYKLSFLDQIQVPVFMPLALFFPRDDGTSLDEKRSRIKRSLAEALAKFYPLAGRVRDNTYVDCNDEGALYVEARVRCELSDILENPVPRVMNRFFPCELDDVQDLAVAVQVNFFECGGLALSLLISHKVADALSFFTFLNAWAAAARGDPGITDPCFNSSELFPPINLSGFQASTGIVKDNMSTRRFVFDAATIASLREQFADLTNVAAAADQPRRRPTRVEALSSFLWSRYMASTQPIEARGNKIYTVLHAVNLRTRMEPPMSERHFGNISRLAITVPTVDAGGYKIVNQVRDAIKQVNEEYVRKLREGEGHLKSLKDLSSSVSRGEVVSFSFTSLCRFPTYEADFGWGKPAWVGSASLTFKNLIVFMDTKSGDGIEAWVNLKEDDMAKFEQDEELLALVSPSVSAQSGAF